MRSKVFGHLAATGSALVAWSALVIDPMDKGKNPPRSAQNLA
jgi:hypothetical protein